jgi:hypothetical protein
MVRGVLVVAALLGVMSGAAAKMAGGAVSSSFVVVVPGRHVQVFTRDTLMRLKSRTITTTYRAGARNVTDTYTGVTLWTLLNAVGLPANAAQKDGILSDVVIVTGSDGYRGVVTLAGIDPKFGHQPDLIAYVDTRGDLAPPGRDGFARLVVPGDRAGGRYVSDLVRIKVVTVVGGGGAPP